MTPTHAHEEPEEYHEATTAATCEARIRRMWYEPPDFSVYDPDMYEMKTTWMSEQVYRVAVEVTKDFDWTEIDGATADEDAM
eukprot:3396201-Pyramimonas_sp.AAC.1